MRYVLLVLYFLLVGAGVALLFGPAQAPARATVQLYQSTPKPPFSDAPGWDI